MAKMHEHRLHASAKTLMHQAALGAEEGWWRKEEARAELRRLPVITGGLANEKHSS